MRDVHHMRPDQTGINLNHSVVQNEEKPNEAQDSHHFPGLSVLPQVQHLGERQQPPALLVPIQHQGQRQTIPHTYGPEAQLVV